MYKHPEWEVDPRLYEMFNLDRKDVDEEHQYLIPYMEQLETGELIDLHELNHSDFSYLGNYYYGRVGTEEDYLHLIFLQEVRFDKQTHNMYWVGYLKLPHVPSAEEREKERIKNEEQEKRNRRAKVVETIFFFRELIRLFFGG